MTKIKVSGNSVYGPRLSLSRPTKSPLVVLLIRGCGWSSAHGAVLVTPAVPELQVALRVYELPTAREPCGPEPEPRQRLKTDRADIFLLAVVVVHRAGGRGGALRLSLGHQAGRVLVRGRGPICVALRNPNPEMV